MNLSYYPGCSLHGSARDYAESILGVCSALDIRLEEIPDWNCCGATAAHSIDHRASIDLAGRNLNLAAELPHADMLVPCPMCFNRLKTAATALRGEHSQRYGIKLDGSLPQIQVSSRQFNTRPVIDAVGSRGAAAIPIGNFRQTNVQSRADPAYGFGIVSCRSLKRTARIIG